MAPRRKGRSSSTSKPPSAAKRKRDAIVNKKDEEEDAQLAQQPTRGRGRPRKNPPVPATKSKEEEPVQEESGDHRQGSSQPETLKDTKGTEVSENTCGDGDGAGSDEKSSDSEITAGTTKTEPESDIVCQEHQAAKEDQGDGNAVNTEKGNGASDKEETSERIKSSCLNDDSKNQLNASIAEHPLPATPSSPEMKDSLLPEKEQPSSMVSKSSCEEKQPLSKAKELSSTSLKETDQSPQKLEESKMEQTEEEAEKGPADATQPLAPNTASAPAGKSGAQQSLPSEQKTAPSSSAPEDQDTSQSDTDTAAAPAPAPEDIPADQVPPDPHPFPIGAVITAHHEIDGQEHFCDVIERAVLSKLDKRTQQALRPQPPGGEEEGGGGGEEGGGGEGGGGGRRMRSLVETDTEWRYYVHFHQFNRRMDAWLRPDRVLRAPNQARAALRELRSAVAGALLDADGEGEAALEGGGGGGGGGGRRRTADEDLEGAAGAGAHHGAAVGAGTAHDESGHGGLDEAALREHEEVTKVKNVNTVYLGRAAMETWYFSPFPAETVPPDRAPLDALYFCQYTLRFFRHESELRRWQRRPNLLRHPPGNEIYRHNGLAMFEVDGAHEKIYCENLSYFAKLFLDHKTLYYDTECFLFYIMCEIDDWGYNPVGYFSKEKYSETGYNLACILTFPAFQKRGFGRFLIEFSYALSVLEEKVGSPEKPLSDLGLVSYRSFWAARLLRRLRDHPRPTVSVTDLARATSIVAEDVVYTLQYLGVLKYVGGAYILTLLPEILDDLLQKYPEKEPRVNVDKIHWTPPITSELLKFGKDDKYSIHSKKQPAEDIGH